jgi:hypothetical protein
MCPPPGMARPPVRRPIPVYLTYLCSGAYQRPLVEPKSPHVLIIAPKQVIIGPDWSARLQARKN